MNNSQNVNTVVCKDYMHGTALTIVAFNKHKTVNSPVYLKDREETIDSKRCPCCIARKYRNN